MTEIDLGAGKRGRRAWAFDDVAVVPSRRTRDPQDVSTAWNIDAYKFDLPVLAAPMDSAVSPATAIQIGKLGGLGVLDLEGLWTRYEDPSKQLAEIAKLSPEKTIARMQGIYAEPIKQNSSVIASQRFARLASLLPARFHRSEPSSSTRPLSRPASTFL
jgi:IMP dehydrogenase